jgi:uncharacterized membrane protein
MREFRSEQSIHASAHRVWDVLANVTQWPKWTPSVSRVELLTPGPLGIGSRVKIYQPKLRPAVWSVTIWEPQHRFQWRSGGVGIRVSGDHHIESVGDGCVARLSVCFEGLASSLLARLYGRLTDEYIKLEATGLKREAEHCAGLHAGR